MSKQTTVTIGDQEFKLQSVSPSWYYEFNDKCGITGGGRRDSVKYMDGMFKNVVTSPPEVKAEGMKYFDDRDDLKTPEKLISLIESFLRE